MQLMHFRAMHLHFIYFNIKGRMSADSNRKGRTPAPHQKYSSFSGKSQATQTPFKKNTL